MYNENKDSYNSPFLSSFHFGITFSPGLLKYRHSNKSSVSYHVGTMWALFCPRITGVDMLIGYLYLGHLGLWSAVFSPDATPTSGPQNLTWIQAMVLPCRGWFWYVSDLVKACYLVAATSHTTTRSLLSPQWHGTIIEKRSMTIGMQFFFAVRKKSQVLINCNCFLCLLQASLDFMSRSWICTSYQSPLFKVISPTDHLSTWKSLAATLRGFHHCGGVLSAGRQISRSPEPISLLLGTGLTDHRYLSETLSVTYHELSV